MRDALGKREGERDGRKAHTGTYNVNDSCAIRADSWTRARASSGNPITQLADARLEFAVPSNFAAADMYWVSHFHRVETQRGIRGVSSQRFSFFLRQRGAREG